MGYKISNIIISIVVVSLLVTIFISGITDLADKNDLEFDNASLERYNRMQESQELANSIRQNESESKQGDSLFDIIGELFNKGLNTIRATKSSFNTIDELSNQAGEDLFLGVIGKHIAATIAVIMIIIFVIGIIVSNLLKRDQ
ncbi:hypothetical protein ES702_02747 [subsurface metagenome]